MSDDPISSAKLVVMLVVSVAVLGAGCARDGGDGANSDAAQSATSTPRLLEGVPAPDPVTPDGVAVTALREIFTWRPAQEAPGASLERARKWLGPSLIRVLDAQPALTTPAAPVSSSTRATGVGPFATTTAEPTSATPTTSVAAPVETAPKVTLQWADWAKAKAVVEAFTFASGEKPPGGADPDTEQYKIGIEQTVVYPNGRKESLPPSTVIATVVRTPAGWRLDAYR
ncbi:hypothetical protein [Nocardia goodfellowii]|uniref:Uncharacterized protein n=1 Tax=Nocardia goodfellowii TaxID=882446 RepID=A0ABS4QHU5_9NOCA|nr:hypothetical protein [Nocardia goodfellowii]MBP2190644.1 hypothetical protein [Nocardia goodfellowii]